MRIVRILLYGVGCEDPRNRAWRIVRTQLNGLGHIVWEIDPDLANLLGYNGGLEEQFAWAIRCFKPDIAIEVFSDIAHHDTFLSLTNKTVAATTFGWDDGGVPDDVTFIPLNDSERTHAEVSQFWQTHLKQVGISVSANSTDHTRVIKEGPTVSAVITTYNASQFLGDAIASFLSQDTSDLEIVVVDDGSTEDTKAVVAPFLTDERVRYFVHENIGQTGRIDLAHRFSLQYARGDYIAYLGADDIAERNRVSKQREVMETNRDIDLVHTAGVMIDEHGQSIEHIWSILTSYDQTSVLRSLFFTNLVGAPSVLIRRSLFDKTCGWTGGYAGDYLMCFNASRVGQLRYMPEALTRYRRHESNLSLGKGLERSIEQGTYIRSSERAKCSITELFPSLQNESVKDIDICAAHIEMGLGFLRFVPVPELAQKEFEMAVEIGGKVTPLAYAYLVTFLRQFGDDAAISALLHTATRNHSSYNFTDLPDTLDQLPSANMVSPKPFYLPLDMARETYVWDGTLASTSRILVLPDWHNQAVLAATLHSYIETFQGDRDVDLALATLEVDEAFALERITRALPPGVDLTGCASITIESWPHLVCIPLQRFSATLDLRQSSSIMPEAISTALKDARCTIEGARTLTRIHHT